MDLIAPLLGLAMIAALVIFLVGRSGQSRQDKSHVDSSAPGRERVSQSSPPQNIAPADHRPQTRKPTHAVKELSGRCYVIDGDTIVIAKQHIRLFGIDAPELDHPYGQKAKWAMVALCKGRNITARIVASDVHDRVVAKCFLDDGRDLSAELVKKGLAIDWPKYSGGAYGALETHDARKKLWRAVARQQGRMKF